MKRLSQILLLFLATLPHLHAQAETPEELFFAANVHAANGEYAEAISLYKSALEQHPSSNLHYNLGNAYYQLKDVGHARLHWEKALTMDPGHAEARQNLQILLNELGFSGGERGLMQIFSFQQWTWIALLSFWFLLFSLLARRWKRTAWLLAPISLAALALAVSATSLVLLTPTRHAAIIVADNALLRVAPTPESPTTTPIKPAQRVQILDTYKTFHQITLPSGQQGYVQSDELEAIW